MSAAAVSMVVQNEVERHEQLLAENLADELKLWEWGVWTGKDFGELGYPRCVLQFAAKGWGERDLRRVVPKIGDDEGIRIDAAVAMLPFSHRKVIITIYRLQVPSRELPRVLGWTAHRIQAYQREALGMLWGLLNMAPNGKSF